jgi:hypothetical protein
MMRAYLRPYIMTMQRSWCKANGARSVMITQSIQLTQSLTALGKIGQRVIFVRQSDTFTEKWRPVMSLNAYGCIVRKSPVMLETRPQVQFTQWTETLHMKPSTGIRPIYQRSVKFDFYEPIWYYEPNTFPEDKRIMLGEALKIGRALFYWILPSSGIPIARSTVQLIADSEKSNEQVQAELLALDKAIQEHLVQGEMK